ncbi:MAG TPA: ABC transporter permease subunit [bacterium]|nr:ABC transporter permease subunit [bacterium]
MPALPPRRASASKNSATLWQDLGATILVFGLGYVFGAGLGIVLGLLVGIFPALRAVAEPYIAFFNAMPRIVLLPLLLVILGFGYLPQVLLVALVIMFIVLMNVAAGVSEVRRDILNNARILGANNLALIRHVYLPSVGLWVLSSARVTVGYALQATVAAQVIGVGRGLGFRLIIAQTQYRADEMFAVFAVLLLHAVIVDMVPAVVERRVRRWVPSIGES